MRSILFFIFTIQLIYARDTCYTVQLESQKYSQESLNFFTQKSYPDQCKIMHISQTLTVRCGCYEKYDEAVVLLKDLQSIYKRAVVTSTYSDRFGKKQRSVSKSIEPSDKKDEELRLMLQVFLYRSDLDKAYEVAKLATEKNKSSYYWNQKMAEICQWSNRAAESMYYLKNIYNITKDKKIEQTLIDYGYDNYRYEDIKDLALNRALRNPTEENIDFMIEVYTKIGYPEEAIEILEKEFNRSSGSDKSLLLEKALEISLELGDIKGAKKYVERMKKRRPYSKKVASLIADYYYIKQDMTQAYQAILDAKEESNKSVEVVEFYEFKSDLAWYLQKNRVAAEASLHLMEIQKARLSDYERISFFYKKRDPAIALHALKESYLKFKYNYLFYAYATEAIEYKKYDALKVLMQKAEAEESPVTKESLYWITKAQLYGFTEDRAEEKRALDYALKLSPNSEEAKISILWFTIEQEDQPKIRASLQRLEEEENLDESYYFPIASAYLALNDVNRANFYLQKLLEIKHAMVSENSFKLLLAAVYQAQGRDELYKSMILEAYKKMKKEFKKKPALLRNRSFLLDYLRLTLQTQSADTFEKRVAYAKKYITKEDYKELMYAYSLSLNSSEMSLKLFHSIKYKPLWMRFNNAYMFQEHSQIENYMDIYLSTLVNVNMSQAAYEDGQQAFAQSNLFEAFRNNSWSSSLYSQYLSLSQSRSDKLELKSARYVLADLEQKYIECKNSSYLYRGYYLLSDIYLSQNSSADETALFGFDDKSIMLSLGLKKLFQRGSIEVDFKYHNKLRSYYGYKFLADYRLSSDLSAQVSLEKSADAFESVQLILGAKKDSAQLNLNYSFVNSTQLDLLHEESIYSAQDGVEFGSNNYSRVMVSRQIRSSYPDMKMGLYYDRAIYSEREGSKGALDRLLQQATQLLGNDFYDIGMNFSYGMVNSASYTRAWRPYVSISPYYNSLLDDYSYSINGGFSGKIWHQDHLVLGASYAEAFNGRGAKVFEFFLNYQFLYKHP